MAYVRGGQQFERKLAELAARLAQPGTLQVGFFANARYPDGTPVAMIAAIQDYGAPAVGIPSRPFFRNMVAAKHDQWPKAIVDLLKTHDVKTSLQLTGEAIKGQLQQSIRDTNSPPLKPATIRRKGFAKPLIDTGQMLNSVDYNVKMV